MSGLWQCVVVAAGCSSCLCVCASDRTRDETCLSDRSLLTKPDMLIHRMISRTSGASRSCCRNADKIMTENHPVYHRRLQNELMTWRDATKSWRHDVNCFRVGALLKSSVQTQSDNNNEIDHWSRASRNFPAWPWPLTPWPWKCNQSFYGLLPTCM